MIRSIAILLIALSPVAIESRFVNTARLATIILVIVAPNAGGQYRQKNKKNNTTKTA
jgi:hypothetical protein